MNSEIRKKIKLAVSFLLALLITVFFVLKTASSINMVSEKSKDEGKRILSEGLYRAVATCYSTEGIYPPNIEYIEDNYHIIIDKEIEKSQEITKLKIIDYSK